MQIHADSHIMTDDAGQYHSTRGSRLTDTFAAHDAVKDGIDEYVRGDIHTIVEGYFSIFKCGLMGAYHHVSEEHLKRYLCEFDFRYNYRSALDIDDTERELMSNLVYGRHESGGFPADHSLVDSVNKLHAGEHIGKLAKAA